MPVNNVPLKIFFEFGQFLVIFFDKPNAQLVSLLTWNGCLFLSVFFLTWLYCNNWGTFVWDRLCLLIFAPEVFAKYWENIRTTSLADLFPLFTTIAKTVIVITILATGNILFYGLGKRCFFCVFSLSLIICSSCQKCVKKFVIIL